MINYHADAEAWAELIRSRERFCYLRIGDGELRMSEGQQLTNQSKTTTTPELTKGLKETLAMPRQPGLIFGVGGTVRRLYGEEGVYDHLRHPAPDIVDLEPLYYDIIEGRANPFIEALRSRCVIHIGPTHHNDQWDGMISKFGCGFEVSNRDCHKDIDELFRDVTYELEHPDSPTINDDVLIVASLGISSLIFGRMIWERYPEISFFDAGSIFEPFFGGISVHPRGWYRKIKPGAIEANLRRGEYGTR